MDAQGSRLVRRNRDGTVSVGTCDEHVFADEGPLREWLDGIRVAAYETACPACAGVDLHPEARRGGVNPTHAKRCAECAATAAADGGWLFAEKTIAPEPRTRAFCSAACQRSFYEAGSADGGMPPVHSKRMLVASVIRPYPEGRTGERDDPRDKSDEEKSNAELFYKRARDVPPVIRDHSARRARLRQLPAKPLFLSMGDALQRLDTLDDELARDEMRAHYTLSKKKDEKGIALGWSTLAGRMGIAPILSEQLIVKVAKMEPLEADIRQAVRNLVDWRRVVEREKRISRVPLPALVTAVALVADGWVAEVVGYANQVLSIVLDLADSMLRYAPHADILENFRNLWEMMELDDQPHGRDLIQRAERWIAGQPGFVKHDPVMFTHAYAREPNYESLNDVIAGMRVSALVHSGISPAFATVVDYFACNAGLDGFVADDLNLFVVSEKISHETRDVMRKMLASSSVGAVELVNMARSMLAQILLALEAAQSKLRFVHSDLHVGNVMLDALPKGYSTFDAVLRFRRPDGRNMFIPARHTDFKIARIIDFGRSRVDNPDSPGDRSPPAYVNMHVIKPISGPDYDRWTDMRIFGHDFANEMIVYMGWRRLLLDQDWDETLPVVADMFAALEVMIGMDQWTEETMLYPRYTERLPLREGLDRMLAPVLAAPTGGPKLKAYFRLWADALRKTRAVRMQLGREKDMSPEEAMLLHFRVTDIYGSRPDQVVSRDPGPTGVLDLPFFQDGEEGYRPRPAEPSAPGARPLRVDFMGDAMAELRRSTTGWTVRK
jgi:hypothetical protein